MRRVRPASCQAEFDRDRTQQCKNSFWSALPPEKSEELLCCASVTALGSSGIPTRFKSSIIAPGDVKDVIVHHLLIPTSDIPLDLVLRNERVAGFVTDGLRILIAFDLVFGLISYMAFEFVVEE